MTMVVYKEGRILLRETCRDESFRVWAELYVSIWSHVAMPVLHVIRVPNGGKVI